MDIPTITPNNNFTDVIEGKIKSREELLSALPEYMTNSNCRRWLLHINKVPHYANGCKRSGPLDSHKDLAQLVSFEEAYGILMKGGYTGLGFALGPDDKGGYWQGIDLDDIWSKQELYTLKLPGYVELSQSGKGLHAIGYGRSFHSLGSKENTGIEAYSHGRYFTVTGCRFNKLLAPHPECLANYVEQVLSPMHGINVTQSTGLASNVPKSMAILSLEQMADLRAALFSMSADGRELWIAMGQALRWVVGGFELWTEWSATSYKHRGDSDLVLWDGFSGDNTSYKAVFTRAQKMGWINPRSIRPDPKMVGFGNTPLLPNVIQVERPLLAHQLPHHAEPLPELPRVLPFDYSYLPDILREYVCDISERMQCPPDYAAVAVYVMIGTACGCKIGIRPMKENDWTVIPIFWGAVVGNSGMMKSPTLSECLVPLKKLAARSLNEFNHAMKIYETQNEMAKIQKSVNKSAAKKALQKQKNYDITELLALNEVNSAPILKRYITNNASYEALGELLIENPNGILVECDEIIGLLKQLDASGQEAARAFYLTAADGDKSYTFDRIVRGKGLHIESVCVSILGGIQPGVLADYVRHAVTGNAGADGLLQRFGLMVYPDISPDWKEVDRLPNKIVRTKVTELIEKIDTLNPYSIGAESECSGETPFLRFANDAQEIFSKWREILEKRIRSGEEHPAIVSHISKYRKLIPALALINHLCDSGKGPVTKDSLLRAIAYSEYLESHAQRIYSYATTPEMDAAKTLLKHLKAGKLTSPFKARDVSQKRWVGLSTPAKTEAAINVLLEYGHLTVEEITDTGGRPTKKFHWHKET